MSECARSCCANKGILRCSVCLLEPYCGGDCQRVDWKSHKLVCKTLKKLSLTFQPYHEVARVMDEVYRETSKKKQLGVRVQGHLTSYAEHQFGNRVPGTVYRERDNGERIDNWIIEIEILFPFYMNLATYYQSDVLLSVVVSDNLRFPHLERMLDLLSPWSAYLDLNSPNPMDKLDKSKISTMLKLSTTVNYNIASIYTRRNQFNPAEKHCQQAVSYARLYEGGKEEKTSLLCRALKTFYELLATQGNYDDALAYVEEAYNCVAVAYNPVHPKVQNAANTLIECLVHKNDLGRAETFAQMTLDSLKDQANRLNQDSEEVATGYYNLANVINQQMGDFKKAEMLVRESLRIRVQVYSHDNLQIGYSCGLLGRILQSQGNLGNETKELFERALAIDTRHCGPDGLNTAFSNFNTATFYHELSKTQQIAEIKKDQLRKAYAKYVEALRIYRNILGLSHHKTMEVLSVLSIISRELST